MEAISLSDYLKSKNNENTHLEDDYQHGRDAERAHHWPEAIQWYRKAAEQGHVKAQFQLALNYWNGLRITQNYAEAHKWFLKAAEQNSSEAMMFLWRMYRDGDGVAKDNTKAYEWCKKAAALDNAEALYFMGDYAERGVVIAKDELAAYCWYKMAADKGYSEGQRGMKRTERYQQRAEWFYNACVAEKQKNYSEAFNWFLKLASAGYAHAQFCVAEYYYMGHGIQGNEKMALSWYTKAAEQNYPPAQRELGRLSYFEYLDNENGDPWKYKYWMERAIRNGDKLAKRMFETEDYMLTENDL